jgi:ABC-type sugar transport system ATPase subunit
MRVADLSIANQQMVEIARALTVDAKAWWCLTNRPRR